MESIDLGGLADWSGYSRRVVAGVMLQSFSSARHHSLSVLLCS